MPNEIPLQWEMFSSELVDNRTPAQKRLDQERSLPRQMEMFSPRETAQFGAGLRSMALPATARLKLEFEDHRTPEEVEADIQREAEKRTHPMFADAPDESDAASLPEPAPLVRIFEGYPDRQVRVDGRPLPLTETGERHSPDGFNWGFEGSGPAALAHALLAFVAGEAVADVWYEVFKRDIVATWPAGQSWRLTEAEVRAWLADRVGDRDAQAP